MKQNIVETVHKVTSHLGLNMSYNDVELRLVSHPDFPSLKSVSDTLNSWTIRHTPVKLGLSEFQKVKLPFVVHLNLSGGILGFVTRLEDGFIWYSCTSQRTQKESIKSFSSKYSGVSVLIDNLVDKTVGKPVWHLELPTLLRITTVAVVLSFFYIAIHSSDFEVFKSKVLFLAFLSKSVGLLVSVLLLARNLEASSVMGCKIGDHVDCNSVLNSRFSKIYGAVSWSDVGFVYFLSSLILLSFGNRFHMILGWWSVLVAPYVLISLFQQGFLIKKWCLVCLGILSVITLDLILTFYSGVLSFPAIGELIYSGLISLTIGVLYFLNKGLHTTLKVSKDNELKYLQLKRNPAVLNGLLNRGTSLSPKVYSAGLLLGSKTAVIELVVFMSLACSYCAKTIKEITSLVEDTDFNVRLILLPGSDKLRNKRFIVQLYNYYEQLGSARFIEALNNWYDGEIKEETLSNQQLDVLATELTKKNTELMLSQKITQLPAFYLQGGEMPKDYQLSELTEYKGAFLNTLESKP